MARRSDHSKEQLKELIIDSGWKIIKSEGLSGFSARGVAKHIGYTVGTIYNVFETHDNLILNINAKTLDHWYKDIEKLLSKNKKPSIYLLAEHYISYSQKHYNEWMALFEHSIGKNEKIPEWYMKKMNKFFELLESLIISQTKRNDAAQTARVLWAGIHGICILSLSKKLSLVGSESAEKLAKSFVENYLRGIENE